VTDILHILYYVIQTTTMSELVRLFERYIKRSAFAEFFSKIFSGMYVLQYYRYVLVCTTLGRMYLYRSKQRSK
jgi:hypothetical protein